MQRKDFAGLRMDDIEPLLERDSMTDEFLALWRRLMSGERVDFAGKYLRVDGAQLHLRPVQHPYPPLYFGGSSEVGREVAAVFPKQKVPLGAVVLELRGVCCRVSGVSAISLNVRAGEIRGLAIRVPNEEAEQDNSPSAPPRSGMEEDRPDH